ncbi:cation channel sperm-associated auxiliary subunit gamma [Apodemus sylvaticus]|uniref:cation channel sperm-associated auxiliary subunit gamma n=1 Tax=Apodemus sylvaticus TaxID=10129 RepID=UPI002241E21E|nr:cation channel sperm-associated auxiliary subunit gamma [Apodemus sylvaticus]
MDRREERWWREKVSEGTVRIAKSAWVWNDGSSCGQRTIFTQEGPRDHERSPGRDTYWGRERIIYERGFGEDRAKLGGRTGRERLERETGREDWSEERLPFEDTTEDEERTGGIESPRDQQRFPKEKAGAQGRAGAEDKAPGREKGFTEKWCEEQESQVAWDPGRRTSQDRGRGRERKESEDLLYLKPRRLSQDQGRGRERRQSEDLNYCHSWALNQEQGRGQERRPSDDPTYRNARRLSQDQGRAQERRPSEDQTYRNARRLSQDQGRGQERKRSEEWDHRNTRGLRQDEGRGRERRQSEDSNYDNIRGLYRDQGRGQGRRWSEDSNYRNAPDLIEDQRPGQERKRSEDLISRKTQTSEHRGVGEDSGKDEKTRSRFLSRDRAKRKGRGEEQCEGREPCEGGAKSAEGRSGRENRKGSGRGVGKRTGTERFPSDQPRLGNLQVGVGPHVLQVSRPAMSPVSLVWMRKPNLWAFWVLRLVLLLLLLLKSWAADDLRRCTWLAVLNKFEKIGSHLSRDRFVDHEPIDTVTEVFRKLTDSPIEQSEQYLSFPYYLQINFSCPEQNSEELARKGHLMGMKPMVLVNFISSVNFYVWELENMQILMEAAPMRSTGYCPAEAMCILNWYTPMPIKNGSVVFEVDIYTNGIGPFIPRKRFYVNMNGYMRTDASGKAEFTIGYESLVLKSTHFRSSMSRPLWYTVRHAPVYILGGFYDEKSILFSDSNFDDYVLLELSIDSCWVGSYYCPILGFSATIHDAISTESTLFIRQNQLVYYFTGTYPTLYDRSHGSSRWVRVLPSECIKRLCPVYSSGNGSEYILALTTGKNEGYIHIGTITAGLVSFHMVPDGWSICEKLPGKNCSIDWATYVADEWNLLLLVKIDSGQFYLVNFNTVSSTVDILYKIPRFIPEAKELDFLVLLDRETYTSTPTTPKGLYFNTLNNMLYIWGNFILQSYNREHFILLADFPKEFTIKYMINSYNGHMAVVTENEQIWYFLEGGYDVYQLIPSEGWNIFLNLQKLQKSPLYSDDEALVSVFYENGQLYQLVYLFDIGKERLVKRPVPVGIVMEYNLHKPISVEKKGNHSVLDFQHVCPFREVHVMDIPKRQHAGRYECYLALPPLVSDSLGFHNNFTLAVFQGLVYYLLWLHSKYDKPYADPVHDPTWSWWQHKSQYKDYFFYLFSNRLAAEGMYINMNSYQKLYNISSDYGLPELIFLDKGNWFSVTVVLLSHEDTFTSADSKGALIDVEKKLAVAVIIADPECLSVTITQDVLLNRNAVVFKIKIVDLKICSEQGRTGHNIKKTSMMVKILGAPGKCFQKTYLGTAIRGFLMVPVYIGCPPGKRLAFDVSYTVKHSAEINKHYFDCVNKDPEMPCFLFRDLFQPFFLVQDLVTGDSGSFMGSYVLKVVGGGPTMDTIRDYSEEEIFRYNSPMDKTKSLIWVTKVKRTTDDNKFYIMSHESPGIEWLCMENSPCYDITPETIYPPEFFLKLLVSNRGVDDSTYCDYQLTFIVHIHGLPLSNKRSSFIVFVSTSFFLVLVFLYIVFCLLWPHLVRAWVSLRWRINNIMASESYYTYASSTGGFSLQSHSSEGSAKAPSRAGSKENVQAKRA